MKEKRKKVKHLDTNICIKIDTKLLEEFKETCKKEDKVYSKVIRKLMTDYIERENKYEQL